MNIDGKIKNLLEGKMENYILPFFWQHGEDEETLRHYMKVIQESGCGAVCVESRPHPDFCGPRWWRDMDIILEEARKREMKVWILDDSHFPTGFANGAVKEAPLKLHRQSVCVNQLETEEEAGLVEVELKSMIPPEFKPVGMEQYVLPAILKDAPHYEDDQILSVTAVEVSNGERLFLDTFVEDGFLRWQKPAGTWEIWVTGLSRNCGPHRDYINMLSAPSCKLLLDAVYEPHWQHYKEDFGKTIAGFFSDEPELGNGHLYFMRNMLGTDQDLPFSDEMPRELERRLGRDWKNMLYLLWNDGKNAGETARVRYAYMDSVTKLVRQNFSRQIGGWCRSHGVEYVGHIIEDDNAHGRTGSSLGHYFRGLDGQDMSGIDDIGGQVLPQGEEEPIMGNMGVARDGEFYHYMLGALAASAAAIEPGKKGRAMCEIFGNYGWAEGVRLEKYLADHFMVRGINHFVPHAFSPKAFPDPDCPPHFYANGHNPQYRHFGCLIRYMNRICTLISDGSREASVAVLYHGEAEWTGDAMLTQKPARRLAEAQIGFDCIPADVFGEPEHYGADFTKGLTVNGRSYDALIVPYAQYVTEKTAREAANLRKKGFPVLFLEGLPQGICDGRVGNKTICNGDKRLLTGLADCPVVKLEDLIAVLEQKRGKQISVFPENSYLRVMHYKNEQELYYFVNEGPDIYEGTVEVSNSGKCYVYDAWENCCRPAVVAATDRGTKLKLTLEPLKSCIVVFGKAPGKLVPAVVPKGEMTILKNWSRSLCESVAYPAFVGEQAVTVPDKLEEEYPQFSGFARYRTEFEMTKSQTVVLEVTDASEGVEVFVNGTGLGIQIAPPCRYDLTPYIRMGKNELVIEVATTLERKCYGLMKDDPRTRMRGDQKPVSKSGLTGAVWIYMDKQEKSI